MATRKKQNLLDPDEQLALHDTLDYLNVSELKQACAMFDLPSKGKKGDIITRIITYLDSGVVTQLPTVPPQSLAKNHPPQDLRPKALMLQGGYKNDAKTRALFKEMIGPHFHYTAFGVDWLMDRWLQGDPPTYQEFADYWVEETERRKLTKVKPKSEWRLITFMQEMHAAHPLLTIADLFQLWHHVRNEKVKKAFEILEGLKK